MLNRRQFVCAAAAGAAAFARVTDILAAPARYDLIIKGGRVIDGNKRTGRQRLFPSGTVLGGKRVRSRA